MADYSKEEIKRIEQKWQDKWVKDGVYKTTLDTSKPKYYALDMFPYPSGAGLHVGHPLGYIASDIVSRYKRTKGFNVLHPMGFDSFGLPAEQYAIQTGQHPAVTTAKNIATYKRQLKQIAFSFDWDREVQTSDPSYYKWTQWIFGQLFNAWYNKKSGAEGKTEPIATLVAELEKNGNKNIQAVCDEDTPIITADQWKAFDEKSSEAFLQKYRIAYLSETMVNWCAALGTVLSNDEVKDGVSERGGYPVERIKMMQWSMRITAYAERLLKGLDTIDWPEPVKEMQRNWIGKSIGCELDFAIDLTPGPSTKERGTGSAQGKETAQDHIFTTDSSTWQVLKEYARENRKNPTEAEDIVWQAIRNSQLGYKFRRQHAIDAFIVDFVCLEKNLIIEIDGAIHEKQKEADEFRTGILNQNGFKVIRFTNDEVLSNIQQVITKIKTELASPSPLERGPGGEVIRVFTTRIDTIYGVTFMVLAPEHELVDKITTPEQREEVATYVEVAKNRSERERMSEVKRISGAFTGAYVINPFNNAKVPVWIADYVLAGYGTGAVMAVPSSDTRDYAFAKHFNLPIIDVLEGPTSDITKDNFDPKSGTMINSDFLNGLDWKDAIDKALQKVEDLGIGVRKVNYRMRDAIFGRQRYWGEPFPVYYQDGLPKLVEAEDLPITLPEIDEYKPTETGEPPLARAKDWLYKPNQNSQASPLFRRGAGGEVAFPFEHTTMPGWAGSSWYWFRYMADQEDRKQNVFAPETAIKYWKEVDLYIGGSEHATGHLLYSRFWCKALKDLGYVPSEEPFKKMINQGHIQGVSQYCKRFGFNTDGVSKNKSNEILVQGRPPLAILDNPRGIYYSADLNPIEGETTDINIPIEYVKDNIIFDLENFSIKNNLQDVVFATKHGYFLENTYIPYISDEFTVDTTGHQTVAKKAKFKLNQISFYENGSSIVTKVFFEEPQTIYYSFETNPDIEVEDEVIQLEDLKANQEIILACKFGYYQKGKYILYDNFVTKPVVEKMSKSKYNVVNPDDIINAYGADTLRLYEMFLGPLELSKPWNTNGIDGVYKFLRRFWNLFHDSNGNFKVSTDEPSREELKVLHKTLKKVEEDIEKFSFNTTVSEFMICCNELSSLKCNKRAILEPLVIALSPYAPHIAEELWEKLGHNQTILNASFVSFDNQYLVESSFEYPISINGKVRAKMNFALDMPKEDVEKVVLASEIVLKWTEGKPPKKVIVVPGRIVNVVI